MCSLSSLIQGIADMTFKDWTDIALQVGTLGVTVYFTSQLVKNDNNRAFADENRKHLIRFKNQLLPVIGERGSLQRVGSSLRRRNQDKQNLILEAFEEAYYEAISRDGAGSVVTPEQFHQLMQTYEPDHWNETR